VYNLAGFALHACLCFARPGFPTVNDSPPLSSCSLFFTPPLVPCSFCVRASLTRHQSVARAAVLLRMLLSTPCFAADAAGRSKLLDSALLLLFLVLLHPRLDSHARFSLKCGWVEGVRSIPSSPGFFFLLLRMFRLRRGQCHFCLSRCSFSPSSAASPFLPTLRRCAGG